MRQKLRHAVDGQRLRDLDYHFAACVCEVTGCDAPELWLAAALASRATADGHVCIALDEAAGRPVLDDPALVAPALAPWREVLRASGAVGQGADMPLVLDERARLYLGRYWHFEQILVRELSRRATAAEIDVPRARAGLARLFPASDDADDPQRRAAAVALLRRLAVVSGGPGTGKTTTVTRLLALLVEQSWPAVPRIALAAPTGKAAARLTESIRHAKQALVCDEGVRAAIVEEASTLHRLLRAIPGETGFRHHAGNPLHLDVLVVDEASMVDVSLMARLLDALPAHARLILLGDRDQLSSVEAGSVLGDICNRGEEMPCSQELAAQLARLDVPAPAVGEGVLPAMADSLSVLTRSYRFGSDSGIGRLARAVNRGNAQEALAVCDGDNPDTAWREVGAAGVAEAVGAAALAGYRAYLETDDPAQALVCFGRFRFLCALRTGPFGVAQVNAWAEAALRRAGLLPGHGRHYPGRPVLITRNDYALGLFNGDIGIILPDPQAEGRLRAFFAMPDGQLRRVLLHRLPAHETVFAMTVHKSQGSEFDHCLVLMPDVDVPVVSRELVYTAITRARRKVELWGNRPLFTRAVQRRIERSSGLRDALWRG
ncbi:MAG: exodeoxyribonuclease V subunit alpha [Thiohalomonadaceae bacterium]